MWKRVQFKVQFTSNEWVPVTVGHNPPVPAFFFSSFTPNPSPKKPKNLKRNTLFFFFSTNSWYIDTYPEAMLLFSCCYYFFFLILLLLLFSQDLDIWLSRVLCIIYWSLLLLFSLGTAFIGSSCCSSHLGLLLFSCCYYSRTSQNLYLSILITSRNL